jgi:tetratricopeptide (TPR) repeat protein
MEPSKRPSVFESTLWFWVFIFWVVASTVIYLLKIPPQPFNILRQLSLSFQNADWSFSLIGNIWLDHLMVLVSVMALMVVFIGTGHRVLNCICRGLDNELERWVWRLALGWLFWGTLALVLALENLFFREFMTGCFALALAFIVWRDRRYAVTRCRPFQGNVPVPKFFKILAVLTGILSLANLLAPEMSWDAMTYQLVLPQFYFLTHGFYPVEGIAPVHYPALGQMFFSWGLLWGNDSIARSFCFLAHLGTALALAAFGARLENPKTGWLAALIYWMFPYLNIFSTRGYVDLFTGFFATMGLGTIILAIISRAKGETPNSFNADLALGILALGAVWGFKYNAVSYWLAGALILVWASRKIKINNLSWLLLIMTPLFFFGPWLLKSWNYAGNPIFPHLPKVFPSLNWTAFEEAATNTMFHSGGWRGLVKLPEILWGIFFNHYSGAPNEEVSFIPWAVLPLFLLGGQKTHWKKPALLAFVVPLLFWLVTSHQLRLISAVISFGAIFCAATIQQAYSLWPRFQKALNILLGFLFGLCVYYLFQGLVMQPNPFAHFLGFQSRSQFLSRILRPEGYVQLMEHLSRTLPPGARVLIMGQQNGYYLNRVSAFDFEYTRPLIKKWTQTTGSPERIYRYFKGNGFTHFLLNSNGMMSMAVRADSMGLDRFPWDSSELKQYEQFLLKYTRKIPLPLGSGYSLYSVEPRNGCSLLPEFLPGTEIYYLRNIQRYMGLARISELTGKGILVGQYLNAYKDVAKQHTEIGYPCFQWAFAALSMDSSSWPEALAMGREGFRRNGDKASWLALQGVVSFVRKRTPQAIRFLEQARELSPEREDVARNLAAVYYNKKEYHKALIEAERASALAPFSDEYRQLTAQLRVLLKKTPTL